MLDLVEKLALSPASVCEEDLEALRRSGWSEVEMLHIVLGSAIFNYLNRVADGLGIRLEYESSLPPPRAPTVLPRAAGGSRAPAAALTMASAGGLPAWIECPAAAGAGAREDEPRNLFLAIGLNPEARDLAREWRAHQLRGTPGLDELSRARVALLSAALEGCGYSVFWHRRRLGDLGEDPRTADVLARGEVPRELPPRERALLAHARMLVLEPWSAREEHIEGLRRAGLDDLAILRLTTLAAYVTFETRVALGLGIALEDAQESD
jgi:uncharacterized peroxidase-related enzyme